MIDFYGDAFATELSLIQDETILAFTKEALQKAPHYFWSIPSSTSGKTHPPDERTDGGRVLHTKRVVRVVQELCRVEDYNQTWTDMLISAALIHDLVVNGPSETPFTKLWSEHDIGLRPYLGEVVEEYFLVANPILMLCESHMGRWSSIESNRPAPGSLAHMLHLADVMASRSWITVDPIELT